MNKGESFLQRTIFMVNIILKILIPPFYSFERLERYCKARIEKNPKGYMPLWFLASLYKDFRKNEEARKKYNALKELGYLTFKDTLNFSEVLFELKYYRSVIELLATIKDDCLKDNKCARYLGLSYLEEEEFKEATIYLEKSIDTSQYKDFWRLGVAYYKAGEILHAQESYNKALILKPGEKDLIKDLALTYIKIGQSYIKSDLEKAELNFKRALEVHPGDKDAMSLLENVQVIKKNYKKVNNLKITKGIINEIKVNNDE